MTGNDDIPALALAAFLTSAPHARPRRRAFPAHAVQVSHARRFVRSYLGQCRAADDTALLTSELVTNSILHSNSARAGKIHVLIAHRCPGTICLAVIDGGAATGPNRVAPDLLTDSGRGLMLVQAIAARWGHDGNDHTRAVWFEISCQ